MTNIPLLLTEKQMEELYGFNRKTLSNARVSGTGLPFVKIRGRVYYKKDDIDQIIAQNTWISTTEFQASRKEE